MFPVIQKYYYKMLMVTLLMLILITALTVRYKHISEHVEKTPGKPLWIAITVP